MMNKGKKIILPDSLEYLRDLQKHIFDRFIEATGGEVEYSGDHDTITWMFNKVKASLPNDSNAKENIDLQEYLNRINDVMWESFFLRDVKFSRKHGTMIADILEEWANKY